MCLLAFGAGLEGRRLDLKEEMIFWLCCVRLLVFSSINNADQI
jgi:hypothetical protein